MKKYIKLNLSFGDRIKVMLFGLVLEDKLPTVDVIVEQKIKRYTPVGTEEPVKEDTNNELNNFIPFFEINDDEVKSNF